MALSICSGLRGGSTEMVGTSSLCAPYVRSRATIGAAWSLVRGTSTRQPNSGLVSYQLNSCLCLAADPQSTVLTLLNLPSVTDANCTPPAWIRSMPAYSGTAVRLETPGTTSKSMPPRTQAAASSATALSQNGSPVTSRTTREPVAACLSTILARADGDRPSPGRGGGRSRGGLGPRGTGRRCTH